MNNPIADDFSSINKRAAEIRAEMQDELGRAPSFCAVCAGTGWVVTSYSSAPALMHTVCENCANPRGEPKP